MSEIQKKNSDVKTEMSELQEKNSDMKTEMSDLKQRNQEQHAINSNMNREMRINKQKYQEQQTTISDLSHTGSWCAYQNQWTSGNSLINYDKIATADSNMNKNALNSGNGEILINPINHETPSNNKLVSLHQTIAMFSILCCK